MTARIVSALAMCGALSACDVASRDGNSGEAVAISASSADGNVSVKLPGIAIQTSMPSGMLKSSGFEIDGVKLFPGSKIESMNVRAGTGDGAKVDIAFSAPGEVDAVRKWFADAFAERKIALTNTGNALSGSTGEGNGFTIALDPAGTGATKGTIAITDTSK